MNLMDEELEEYLEYQKNRKKIWELKMKANKKVEEEENSKDLLTKQKKEKQRNIQKNNNQQ